MNIQRVVATTVFPIIFICFQASAQLSKHKYEAWGDFNVKYYLKPRFSIGADGGPRFVFNKGEKQTYYLRPNIRYATNKNFNVTVGVGNFLTVKEGLKTFEFRPFQDFNLAWPDFGNFYMVHRIRFEQRFFSYEDPTIPDLFTHRGRYLVGLKTVNFDIFQKKIHFQGFWEGFVPLDAQIVEKEINSQRFYFSFGERISDKVKIDFYYILQASRDAITDEYIPDDHIFRVRYFYYFNKK